MSYTPSPAPTIASYTISDHLIPATLGSYSEINLRIFLSLLVKKTPPCRNTGGFFI